MKIRAVTLAMSLSIIVLGCGNNTETPIESSQDKYMPVFVQADGSYPTIPLAKDNIVLKVLQTTVDSLGDFPSVEAGLEHNLKHMEEMANKACSTGNKPDFLLYHEFPLTGYSSGSRTDKLKYTIEIPGPETDRLGKIAINCDAYLVFGTYATDKDWPGHILSINAVINREGKVVKKFWKSRNIKRIYPDREIMTTTIESVRDRYRAMYGAGEEFPVLMTEYGNIAVSTVQFDPFVYASFAAKGTEIMIRTATLFAQYEVRAMAYINHFYSPMVNIAFDIPGYNAGKSLIVGPKAKILAQSETRTEDDIIEAVIPIAEFRKNRRIPNYAYEMTKPVLEQYVQEFPLNHMDLPREQLPETGQEMKTLMESVSRFNKPDS